MDITLGSVLAMIALGLVLNELVLTKLLRRAVGKTAWTGRLNGTVGVRACRFVGNPRVASRDLIQ